MKALHGTAAKRFWRDYRRRHPPRRELALLLQSVAYPYNVGAIFRLADGVGVSQLVLTGITPQPPHPTLEKVGRFKPASLPWRYEKEATTAVLELRAAGYHIVGLELVEEAQPYFAYPYPERVCLVAGHEDHGLTRATLALCDGAVFIPMSGKGLSHNVATAVSIVACHILHVAP